MDSGDRELNSNPIVAMAMRIRARKDLASAIESGTPSDIRAATDGAAPALEAFGAALATGARRLNSILGTRAMTYVRMEKPLRIRLRFAEKRVSLDLDDVRQLVIVRGIGFEGEYQFDAGSAVPALINLSKLSTDAGYGDALTPTLLLTAISEDAQLPRPAHLDGLGPLTL